MKSKLTLLKVAETNHLPKCPKCGTTMKEAAQGERCPRCGYDSYTTAKSEFTPPDYKLRLAALRYGATDARSVWVEKSQVGTVEQFARKWNARDENGTAIATGEVSMEAALQALFKHYSRYPHTHNQEFENKHPRGQGGRFTQGTNGVTGAFAHAASTASRFSQMSDDDRAMIEAEAAAEREAEERGFASDPDYQEYLLSHPEVRARDARPGTGASSFYTAPKSEASLQTENKLKTAFTEAVMRYNDHVQSGKVLGRAQLQRDVLATANALYNATGINPLDPLAKGGPGSGIKGHRPALPGETPEQYDLRQDRYEAEVERMSQRPSPGDQSFNDQPPDFSGESPWLRERLEQAWKKIVAGRAAARVSKSGTSQGAIAGWRKRKGGGADMAEDAELIAGNRARREARQERERQEANQSRNALLSGPGNLGTPTQPSDERRKLSQQDNSGTDEEYRRRRAGAAPTPEEVADVQRYVDIWKKKTQATMAANTHRRKTAELVARADRAARTAKGATDPVPVNDDLPIVGWEKLAEHSIAASKHFNGK